RRAGSRPGAGVGRALPGGGDQRGRGAATPGRVSRRRAGDRGPEQAAELAARSSYGRLLAYLGARARDAAAAEDAARGAVRAAPARALESGRRGGVPEKPEACPLTAPRRGLVDAGRHAQVTAAAVPDLRGVVDRAQAEAASAAVFPDERLKLLFVCAHPAIDE